MNIIAEAAAILTKGRIVDLSKKVAPGAVGAPARWYQIGQMAHLSDLSKTRFFFMGIPAAMGGLDSFPIRAVAIEPGE